MDFVRVRVRAALVLRGLRFDLVREGMVAARALNAEFLLYGARELLTRERQEQW